MPLIEIKQSSNLKTRETKQFLTGKSYLADTNFLLNWQAGHKLVNEVFNYAHKNDCLFFRNVTVHQELIDRLLKNTIGDKVYEYLFNHGLNYLIDGDKETKTKKD